MNAEITEQSLGRYLDDFGKEQQRLFGKLKTNLETKEDKEVQQELAVVQQILTSIIKLRNIKKKLSASL